LQEIRELPPKLPRRLGLNAHQVEAFILELAPHVRHVARVPEVFENPFDRDDSHYVNLALASGARHITSRDRDLLRLMDEELVPGREFRKRFPELRILTPEELLTMFRGRQEQ
jgi:predicted nucleic acid-binding protein